MHHTVLEIASATLALMIVVCLWWFGKQEGLYDRESGYYIISGLGLIFLCGVAPEPQTFLGINWHQGNDMVLNGIFIVQLAGIALGCSLLFLAYQSKFVAGIAFQHQDPSSANSIPGCFANVNDDRESNIQRETQPKQVNQPLQPKPSSRQRSKRASGSSELVYQFTGGPVSIGNNDRLVRLDPAQDTKGDRRENVALSINLEQFQTIATVIPVALVVSRLDDGAVLAGNVHLSHLLGVSLEQLIGQKLTDRYCKSVACAVALERVRQEQWVRDRAIKLQRVDGQWVDAIASFQRIIFNGEQGILIAFQQQTQPTVPPPETETPETENVAIEQLEARLHLLECAIAASRNGIAIADAKHPDLPAIYANPSFERMTGYSASETRGQSCFFLEGPDTDPTHLERLQIALESGSQEQIVSRSYRKDGTDFWNELHIAPVFSPDGHLTHLIGIHRDITEHKKTEETLRLLESAIQQASEAIFVATAASHSSAPRIVFANQAFIQMTGYTLEETIGQPLSLTQDSKTNPAVFQHLHSNLVQNRPFEGESIGYRKDGTEFQVEMRCAPIHNQQGEITHYVLMQRDITARKQVEAKLARQAFYDSLTNLPNRALLLNRLQHMVRKAQDNPDCSFAVLFLDLDRFKTINDSLGHTIGDRLLIAISKRLALCTRPSDTVARLGGDEFAMLLDNVPTAELANKIANRIHQQLSQPFNLDGLEVFASASIGITLSKIGYDCPEDLLRDADTAMHRAKTSQSSHVIFNESMHARAVVLLQLENDLRRAIKRQDLSLYYQPIVSLSTGKIVGFEALVRWQHPEQGIISPEDFIPIAEETGLIVPIGWWVLHEACLQLKHWQAQFPSNPPLKISVNLSCRQFSQPNLLEQIRQTLQQTGLPASSLRLEITESAIIEDAASTSALLTQLRNLGIQLCIDDFGTGYSSLSYLQRFPIDNLKVDRSFISQMGNSGDAAEIVQAVVALAHNLGMSVTAEGVETATQLMQLRSLQCECGQGYLFSKPLNCSAAESFLADLQNPLID